MSDIFDFLRLSNFIKGRIDNEESLGKMSLKNNLITFMSSLVEFREICDKSTPLFFLIECTYIILNKSYIKLLIIF